MCLPKIYASPPRWCWSPLNAGQISWSLVRVSKSPVQKVHKLHFLHIFNQFLTLLNFLVVEASLWLNQQISTGNTFLQGQELKVKLAIFQILIFFRVAWQLICWGLSGKWIHPTYKCDHKWQKILLNEKPGLPPPECKYHRKNNREISWGSDVRIPCTYAVAAAFPYLKKYIRSSS